MDITFYTLNIRLPKFAWQPCRKVRQFWNTLKIRHLKSVWQQDKFITLEEVNLAFKIVMAEKEKDYGKETEDIPERN